MTPITLTLTTLAPGAAFPYSDTPLCRPLAEPATTKQVQHRPNTGCPFHALHIQDPLSVSTPGPHARLGRHRERRHCEALAARGRWICFYGCAEASVARIPGPGLVQGVDQACLGSDRETAREMLEVFLENGRLLLPLTLRSTTRFYVIRIPFLVIEQ